MKGKIVLAWGVSIAMVLSAVAVLLTLFGRPVDQLLIRFANGQVAYLNQVWGHHGSFVFLTLEAHPCRKADRAQDYVSEDNPNAHAVWWYVVRENTIVIYGTELTAPTARHWPVHVEYRAIDWDNPGQVWRFYNTTIKEEGLTVLRSGDTRSRCSWGIRFPGFR